MKYGMIKALKASQSIMKDLLWNSLNVPQLFGTE